MEEAYTTEHWLVRIYRVKPPANRISATATARSLMDKKSVTKTSSSKHKRGRKGTLKHPISIAKGKKPSAVSKQRSTTTEGSTSKGKKSAGAARGKGGKGAAPKM